jgi:uncharacterized membrane protein YqjE
MLAGVAVLAILAVFGTFWTFAMARNPKRWRLWWLDTLNIVDIESSREHRHIQETKLAIGSSITCVFLVLLTVFCVYHVATELQDRHRDKTQFEKDQEETRKQIEIMRSKKEFEKLR